MLTLYRRHLAKCSHKKDKKPRGTKADEKHSCTCPIWLQGTIDRKPVRESLDTQSWSKAEKLLRQREDGNQPKKEEPKVITIADALAAFIKDCESRNLTGSTLRKYRGLSARLTVFATDRNLARCADFTVDLVRDFRSSWKLSPRTASKELERLRAFFNFCVENDWIKKSPAKAIKAPQVRPNPTLPYSTLELSKIFQNADFRTSTFYKLLLHSGLRILDASTLRPERIQDSKLLLYQAKTGQPVWVPLPADLISDLSKLPLVGGFYFAVESEKPESIAEYYRKKLHKIQAGFHAHRFRDSFAVRLLQAGVPLEEVSMLLGHSSIKITEQSYAPWVKARQDRLEDMVRKTWKPALTLIKK